MKCRGLFLESQHISFEMKGLEKTKVCFGPKIASYGVTVLGCIFGTLS
jgi:hypothetical protein